MRFPTCLTATKPSLHRQFDSQFGTAAAMGSFKHVGGRKPGIFLPAAEQKMAPCQITWPWALPERRAPGPTALALSRQEQPAPPEALDQRRAVCKSQDQCEASSWMPSAVSQHAGPRAVPYQKQS